MTHSTNTLAPLAPPPAAPPETLSPGRLATATPTVIPRLAWRDERYGTGPYAWVTRGLNSSTAYVSLSRGLACIFDAPVSRALSHQQVGHLGFTEHQIWNAAGAALARSAAPSGASAEFWVRDAHLALSEVQRGCGQIPRGVQIQARGHTAAGWLAHPQPFTVLHTHLMKVLRPTHELIYYVGADDSLFAFDASPRKIAETVGWDRLIRYSLGFPLLVVTPRTPMRFQ